MEARQAIQRQKDAYISMPRKLATVIDTCVSNIFVGGTEKYQDRKDFVIKSIQNLVDYETKRNPSLKEKLSAQEIIIRRRGNRIHDTTLRIK